MKKEIDWGGFRRTKPIDRACGLKRGKPIDRYYIEEFLRQQRKHIKGEVLEFLDNAYTKKFGGSRVKKSHIMITGNDVKLDENTIVGDLQVQGSLNYDSFDCVIATQVLQYMKWPKIAIENLRTSLKPGGVLLGTWAQTTRTDAYERKRWPFMHASSVHAIEALLTRGFGKDNVQVEVHGNILTLTSFLWGLCIDDLKESEILVNDPDYPLIVAFKAVKE